MWQYGEKIQVSDEKDCLRQTKPVAVSAIVTMLVSVVIALGVGLLTSHFAMSATEKIKKKKVEPPSAGVPQPSS